MIPLVVAALHLLAPPKLALGQSDSDHIEQLNALQALFGPASRPSESEGDTFVFFVNGDADHFQTESVSGTNETLYRVDAFDVERIELAARANPDVNVVVLHDQIGRDHWYTAARPWATWLKVYSQGTLVEERHVSEINMADPLSLAQLIVWTKSTFPRSRAMHLIYRGHPFFPRVVPGSESVPFDYSHPESPFGIREFSLGLLFAGARGHPFASVTLASCRMSSIEVFSALAPYTDYVIASQLPVLETLNAGFSYRFLSEIHFAASNRSSASSIARNLLSRFDRLSDPDDFLGEYPATLFETKGDAELTNAWKGFVQTFKREFSREFLEDARETCAVYKEVSPRYRDFLKGEGRSPEEIQNEAQAIRLRSPDPDAVDLGCLLGRIAANPNFSPDLRAKVQDLKTLLGRRTFVYDAANPATKSGISVYLTTLTPE